MKIMIMPCSLALAAALMLLAGNAPEAVAEDTATASSIESRVERGRYLVTTSGCHDCHTPMKMGPKGPEPDMSRMLSGHPEELEIPEPPALPPGPWLVTASGTMTAWAGPWGVTFTANLTPDRETGLGKWTERNFIETIRTGRRMGRGRAILPPMPIPVYKQMTDEDLAAIFAYLQSIEPLRNRVPMPRLPEGAEAMTD